MRTHISLAILTSSLLVCGCGGGGTPVNPFTGSYNGTYASGATATAGESGTSAVTINSTALTATLTSGSTPPVVISFTGDVNATTSKTQEILATETGGPYNGQTLKADYLHFNATAAYPDGYYKVYIRVPGSTTVNAWVLVITKITEVSA